MRERSQSCCSPARYALTQYLRVCTKRMIYAVLAAPLSLSGVNIAKLGNCPTAMKVKRLVKEEVQQAVVLSYDKKTWEAFTPEEQEAKMLVLEGDCWNHLRNVWLGATTTALTGRLKEAQWRLW
jgi:hypothetical protein